MCNFEGCDRPVDAKGLCSPHYRQQLFGKPLKPLRPYSPRAKQAGPCMVKDCDKPARTVGLCQAHYVYMQRYSMTVEAFVAFKNVPQVCAICDSGERIHIDHDHKCCPGTVSCGECIRGYLCAQCNQGLGHFMDSPDLLDRAIEYLTA